MISIKINKDTLLKPLQIVTGIVEIRNTLPILSNVLIQQDQEKIIFFTSDIDIQMTTSIINPVVDNQFAITVPAKKFQEILRSLPSNIEITLTIAENQLQIKAGTGLFKLQTLPAESFPKISNDIESTTKITIEQKQLKNLFSSVQFSIAQHDTRYYLNGLLLQIENNLLIAVATDSHRLGYDAIELEQTIEEKKSIILPRKTVIEIGKLLKDTNDPVTIEFFEKKVRFSFSDIILISKIIDGNYPNFKRVIPTENTKTFELDSQTFLHILQRVSIFSNINDKVRDVRLIISSGHLKIICKNNEQEKGDEEIEIQYHDDKEIDVNFNITYFLDLLNNLNCEKIYCAFKDSKSSVMITIPEKEHFKYIVMPMKI